MEVCTYVQTLTNILDVHMYLLELNETEKKKLPSEPCKEAIVSTGAALD